MTPLAVCVVEVWTEGAWSSIDPEEDYGGRLMAYLLRCVADRKRRQLRHQGYKARVSRAVIS